jgi:hypothetical protein
MGAFRGSVVTCPRCTDELTNVLEDRGGRWCCRSCDGQLVPSAVFDDLVGEMERTREASNLTSTFDPAGQNERKRIGPDPPSTLMPGTLPCPHCKVLMFRQVFAGQEIDRCSTHGIWFDRDELAAVLERTAGELEPERFSFWRTLLGVFTGL